ncbi:sterol desaturase family protein [Bdellovibrio sp. SKB1291214]|uniref:sterol desaturase family protein n=1 Tax=Bdellovibrio sp. SKB1291214 TaxID=1732569 RepID=UPI000B5165BA|nr:sterol desaturase family protein [Bdellovibrio sp. SKB1291214]UYL07854.1 sterol desaturase family protein [Bdellovibrio sp. SKB1291214]
MNHFEKFESYVPFDLLIPKNFAIAVAAITSVVLFRYLATTFMFYLVFYRRRWSWSETRQIYPKLPDKKIQLYEIKWSSVSSIIFGFAGVLMGVFWQLGWSKIYLKLDQYGWLYLLLSGFLVSVLHDFYFYVTHRWLHTPWAYKRFHAVHHASLHPSPWASFSFHPIESLIEAIPLPLITLFLPLHPLVIIAYLTMATLSAIINHLGFEVMPAGAGKNIFGKWLISGTHHAGHHRFYKYNFGLFYTFWDHILGTQHPEYEKQFQQNTEVKLES